jgi:hypothetical protein
MNFDQLITSLRELDTSLKWQVIRTANVGLTLRNWAVGAYIVEFEQNGADRAEYGANLIREVSNALDVKGLTPTTLELCRRLFSAYPQIPQTLSVESQPPILQTASDFSARPDFAVPVAALAQKLTLSPFPLPKARSLFCNDLALRSLHRPDRRAFANTVL